MLEVNQHDMRSLRSLMRRAEQPYVRIKATALWNLGRGRPVREVADFLGVSATSISNWTRRFRSEGISGLAVRPGRGRKARADASEVQRYARQSPQSFGLMQTRWTLRALAQVVPSLEGFTEMGVWKVLRRAGFRYKRGQPHLHSPDPQYEEKRGPCSRPFEATHQQLRSSRSAGQPYWDGGYPLAAAQTTYCRSETLAHV